MAGETEIQGMKELADALRALPKELSGHKGGPLAKALRAASNVIVKDARARAPVRTGVLKRSIASKRSKQPSPGATETFEVYVRPRHKRKGKTENAFYWRFIEFGTKFLKAQPFLRPAFEAKKNEALGVFADKLGKEIAKANNKVKA